MKNLPIDLLRTLVTAVDQGGFTRAGNILGRTQSTVSLQIKRLEELIGFPLFNRDRGLQLTEDGHLVVAYSRKILDLNDEMVLRYNKPSTHGKVKLGIPNDFENRFLTSILSRYTTANPEATLEVTSDLCTNLQRDFKKGAYDLIMVIEELEHVNSINKDGITNPIMWVTGADYTPDNSKPLPLIMYPEGCLYRNHIIKTLNDANISWRIVYSTATLHGIHFAVEAGMGISALAKSTMLPGLKSFRSSDILPELGNVAIGFYYNMSELSPAAARLLEYLRDSLHSSR
ncbi:LysR substrate-binding domain-containing protein [Dasania sp. GY-MA-18]|uniref:LysR substrate-binding domain-containing protein n=1 Tax=Dasania phycosphaerae TaxID=2950436 RepID=A0A9J6RP85_9GAMM|nr:MULTISPECIES: LysR substrate-binding domain-containing protein [Dasania]MCR8923501.1 LysR substrate-binding domain-containing protein [Dasania sp. GY-MA-18]MCZ0865935.1 LysR substrate-binding domain-containing protein [Dasania phycosphaerae]MCZ0869659.1 LysR substrate-binding domain-containing protein [Dasania phycosphaerae]